MYGIQFNYVYDCYLSVHDSETSKDEWLTKRILPLTKKLVHGYECAECETAFTLEEWDNQQEQKR